MTVGVRDRQLSLLDGLPDFAPQHEGEKPADRFDGLEGEELDEAWLAAGSPLPVPYNCIPLPL